MAAESTAELVQAVKSLKDTTTKAIKAKDDELAELKKQNQHLKSFLEEPDYKGSSPGKIFGTARDPKVEAMCGWQNMGQQLKAIHDARKGCADRGTLDKLYKTCEHQYGTVEKAATGLGEAVGPDGGFLLAPQFVEGVMEIVHKQAESLLERCDKYDMASPRMVLRAVDETSRATGSRRGGVKGFWVDEGATLTSSKPKFRNIDLVPHKLAVLSYVTEELLMDGGSMLEQYVSRYAAEEINFLAADAVINGTGAGKPLGILNSACTVSVAKETGQTAATIQTENIVKMWARLHAGSRENAIWLINQDVLPQLYTMTLGVGTGGVVTFMPAGGLSEKPFATLVAKPILEIEYCPTLGTVGDIILADLKAYIAATRGTVQAATSIHVQFLTDEVAYRFTYRVAGSPWWNAALTPFKGTATQSPFVTLATRA